MSKITVIGSGFSGLSASCYLSAHGHEVNIFEKNREPGGRARQLITESGFAFDMGPSWYWMPGVFEKFFNDFGYSTSDFYELNLLKPAFEIIYGKDDIIRIPNNFDELCDLFESIETGSAVKLISFMKEAEFKYKTGIENLVYKPCLSIKEFINMDFLSGSLRMQVFSSFSRHVRKYFSHPKLLALMEFPVLFLGAMPEETPALYSLMNYAGLKLGTWYPMGGFGKVIDAFVTIAKNNGVNFHFNSPVEKIITNDGIANTIISNGEEFETDGIIASADYQHVEDKLIDTSLRNYSNQYWEGKTFSPSSLIFYIGLNKKLKSLSHHTLFFDEDLARHSEEIYKSPMWPTKPLFYICCPSVTDPAVAPAGHENLFILMPIAPGLSDNEEIREKYFQIITERITNLTGESITDNIVYKKSYCINDFISDYNSYKGNAYGLANTLRQTAILKPKIKNYKINNLFYTGQLTVPGPGVPPSIISGKVAAGLLLEKLNYIKHEINF